MAKLLKISAVPSTRQSSTKTSYIHTAMAIRILRFWSLTAAARVHNSKTPSFRSFWGSTAPKYISLKAALQSWICQKHATGQAQWLDPAFVNNPHKSQYYTCLTLALGGARDGTWNPQLTEHALPCCDAWDHNALREDAWPE